MMISVLALIYFMLFSYGYFVGVMFMLFMFIYFLFSFYLFGVEGMKGDLFGMFGSDYISFFMVMLLMWMTSCILLLFNNMLVYYLIVFIFFGIYMMFMSNDFLVMFIFFEFSMFPMFMMIMIFGHYKERYLAGLYMFIYTMLSSLPMLALLMYMGGMLGDLSMDLLKFEGFEFDLWVNLIFIFMFMVKVPIFLLHIWLPKAHVEAPVFGSMILASVMLKMGGYGVIRCMDVNMISNSIGDLFFCLCLSGSLILSFMCLFQVDLKILVAYSSIVHMCMMMMGFFSRTELGYLGGLIIMLSHGICSSGMFYMVNEIYLITGSRLLMLNKGLMGFVPILSWLWLLMVMNNLGVPPCFGILGELMLIGGCLSYFFLSFFFFIFIIFFVSCFVMNMFSFMLFGYFHGLDKGVNLFTYYGILIHLIPLNFFIIFIGVCL